MRLLLCISLFFYTLQLSAQPVVVCHTADPESASACSESLQESFEKAETLLLQRRAYEALQVLEPLSSGDTLPDGVFRLCGAAHFYLENYKKALYYTEKALVLNPHDAPSLFLSGEIYQALQRPEEAAVFFLKASDIDAEHPEAGLQLYALWMRKEAYSAADSVLQVLEKNHPQHVQVRLTRASWWQWKGESRLAIELAQQAILLDSSDTTPYALLASLYLAQDDIAGALDAFNRWITLDPEDAEAYLQRARFFNDQEEYLLALSDLEEALTLDSSLTEAWHETGYANFQLGRVAPAIEAYNLYLPAHRQDDRGFFNRGNAYAMLGRHKDAEEDYTRALALSPQPDYYYNRALVLYAQQEYRAAIRDLDQYLKAVPSDPEGYYIRCTCLYLENRNEQACLDCETAAFLGKKDIPRKLRKTCKISYKKKS